MVTVDGQGLTTKNKSGQVYIHWGFPASLLVVWLVTIVWFCAITSSAVEQNTNFRVDATPRIRSLENVDAQRGAQMLGICVQLTEIKADLKSLLKRGDSGQDN